MAQPAGRIKIRLKKNDLVEVIAGKDAGKRGKVLQVLRDKGRVIVQGVGFIKRHTRPNPQRNIKGGVVEREGSLHLAKLMIVCPECNESTRVRHKILSDGRKVRTCTACEGVIDK